MAQLTTTISAGPPPSPDVKGNLSEHTSEAYNILPNWSIVPRLSQSDKAREEGATRISFTRIYVTQTVGSSVQHLGDPEPIGDKEKQSFCHEARTGSGKNPSRNTMQDILPNLGEEPGRCQMNLRLAKGFTDFYHDLKTALPEVRHQSFQVCISFAPSLRYRTDEAWGAHFHKPYAENMKCKEKLALSLSFESADGRAYPTYHQLGHKRSANDNLAELRMLLGVDSQDRITFNDLDADAQNVGHVPIGFPKAVYRTLPASLINVLPFGMVESAENFIEDAYQMVFWIKKPENDLLLLLCHCAISEKDGYPFRKWMASSEGQDQYCRIKRRLCEHMYQEEFALSLTVLKCYEMVCGPADEELGFVNEPCLAVLIKHIHRAETAALPDLWQKVASAFMRTCRRSCHPTVLGWLDIALDKVGATTLSDKPLDDYWSWRLKQANEVLHERPRSQPMQREVSKRIIVGRSELYRRTERC